LSTIDASLSKIGFIRIFQEESATAASSSASSRGTSPRIIDADGWRSVIDNYLVDWGQDPGRLEDDGIVPPSGIAVNAACTVALLLRDQAIPAPLRVVPTGDGGIVFEWELGAAFYTLEVEQDGTIELSSFSDGRHIETRSLGHLS